MSKEEIFNYFYTNSENLKAQNILLILLAGLLIAAIVSATYYITYRGVSYNAKFNISLVVIMLISIVIMLMISSNIVISLGMVGALSIVRFRTAIKDSRDTAFIFWMMVEGLCVGSQNFKLALVSTLFIAIFLVLASILHKKGNKYFVIVRGGSAPIETDLIIEQLKKHHAKGTLRNMSEDGQRQEMILEVKTKGEIDLHMTQSIREIAGVTAVNWIAESGDEMG